MLLANLTIFKVFKLLEIKAICILCCLFQFVEMLVRNLKEALKTEQFESARMMVIIFQNS